METDYEEDAGQAWREDCPNPKLHVICWSRIAVRAANHNLETTVTSAPHAQHGVSLAHCFPAERGNSPHQHPWRCDHQRAGMDMLECFLRLDGY